MKMAAIHTKFKINFIPEYKNIIFNNLKEVFFALAYCKRFPWNIFNYIDSHYTASQVYMKDLDDIEKEYVENFSNELKQGKYNFYIEVI